MEQIFVRNTMTSWNGNIFRVTGPLWGESTGHRWIPLTKASDAELLMFSLICAWTKRLNKQSRRRWFETPSRSIWLHCNEYTVFAAHSGSPLETAIEIPGPGTASLSDVTLEKRRLKEIEAENIGKGHWSDFNEYCVFYILFRIYFNDVIVKHFWGRLHASRSVRLIHVPQIRRCGVLRSRSASWSFLLLKCTAYV